ncbi:MAG TPA: permease-like cell division protein FtsX [Jatrophihabitans sp.]|jgi:cell division transport system permease protein
MRASYLMSGVATGIRRNVSMTVALILSTGIALLFLVGSLLINKEITATQSAYKDKLNVSIYLCNGVATAGSGSTCKHKITTAERTALQNQLTSDPQIKSVSYVTPEEAANRLKKVLGSKVVDEAGPGALPASFSLKLHDLKKDYIAVADRYSRSAGVDLVQNQDQSLKIILRLFDTGRIGSAVMAIIVGVCALIQMANTIQTAAMQRRNETGIMRLVGATRWMTQLPFVIEAVLAAAAGAVLATLGGWIAKSVFLDGLLGDQVKSRILQPIALNDVLIAGLIGLVVAAVAAAGTAYATLRLAVRL